MITRETITYLCRLSKLEITEEELLKYESQVEEIIKYLDKLDSITLSDIEPISLEKNLHHLRDDNPKSFESDPLDHAENRKSSYVKGPRIT